LTVEELIFGSTFDKKN